MVRKYLPLEYKHIFVDTEEKLNNYVAYIGMTKKNGKKNDLQSKKCSKEEFYDFLKKNVIKKISDEEVVSYLEKELEQGTFLPKQVNKDNSVIPYQVHMYELRKILENLSGRSFFIQENKEKILQLFEFRIPYYVGPLGRNEEGTEGKFTWAVRKNNEKIYPWNFKDVIDIEESAEKFIRRMTNKCTYMLGEDVLPKDSLLYSKYMVLNELNNLRLNGEKISVELKQQLYKEVFCRYRKVTIKKLKNYLVCEGIVDKKVEITGIDGDFKAQLTAFHDFKEKLTGVTLSQKEKEEIILNIVLFGDDKKLLKQRVMRMHPELTEKQIKSISMLSYKGWGRLSKAFLENITAHIPGTEEVWNIITAMWETNDNLMQILSKNYQFMDRIEEYNSIRKEKNLSYKTVEESDLLESYLKEIAWNDGTNREGHAAKVYFNALFGLEFTRTEDNLINAALNYGYSIILSAFTREIVANGYITQLGVFHDNMFNQFNLASDLMEPFRILVDRQVLTMELEQFEHEEKMQLVNVLNQEVQIDGKIQYVNNAIKIYCKSIFDALSGDDSSLIRFYRIEL